MLVLKRVGDKKIKFIKFLSNIINFLEVEGY